MQYEFRAYFLLNKTVGFRSERISSVSLIFGGSLPSVFWNMKTWQFAQGTVEWVNGGTVERWWDCVKKRKIIRQKGNTLTSDDIYFATFFFVSYL